MPCLRSSANLLLYWPRSFSPGSSAPVAQAITRQFDSLFRKHGPSKGIPVAYLRALAKRESNMDPASDSGPAAGLMQVVKVARDSFNRHQGTSYSRGDTLDPEVSIRIATFQIKRVMDSYRKNHPQSGNLQPNYANPEYAKLVTAGWNSGHSEAGGVGRVASYLENRDIPVTHDSVFRFASAAGATQHLQTAQRQNWQRSVVALFYAQPDAPSGSAIFKLAVVAFFVWAAYKLID